MSDNPLQALCHNFEQVSNFVQHHLSNFIGLTLQSSGPSGRGPPLSISSSSKAPLAKTSSVHPGDTALKGKTATPVTKEELGRATWTFLHTLAAQYPDNPTRQQKKDVKELVHILSRIYPCKDCADHFKEVIRLGHMLSFLSGYVMCIMLLIEASANQYSPVNELMQGGANWSASRKHVKLLEVQQFLGKYSRNLF